MIEAELDEVALPDGTSYSRRPRIRALGQEIIATRRSDAIVCALCRRLIEAGHDPALPMVVKRGDTIALRVRSIGEAAKLTVREETTDGKPRFVTARVALTSAAAISCAEPGEEVPGDLPPHADGPTGLPGAFPDVLLGPPGVTGAQKS